MTSTMLPATRAISTFNTIPKPVAVAATALFLATWTGCDLGWQDVVSTSREGPALAVSTDAPSAGQRVSVRYLSDSPSSAPRSVELLIRGGLTWSPEVSGQPTDVTVRIVPDGSSVGIVEQVVRVEDPREVNNPGSEEFELELEPFELGDDNAANARFEVEIADNGPRGGLEIGWATWVTLNFEGASSPRGTVDISFGD